MDERQACYIFFYNGEWYRADKNQEPFLDGHLPIYNYSIGYLIENSNFSEKMYLGN